MTTNVDIYVVDTHALVWYLTDDRKLSKQVASILDRGERGEATIVIPTIVLAELLTIVEKKRAALDMTKVLDWMISSRGLLVDSFDLVIFSELMTLGAELDLHDRIIAATANRYNAPVLTQDPALSGATRAVW